MTANNKNIEKLIHEKDSKGESYTKADIEFISHYSGKGGTKEKDAGILHQFYTPDWICDIMYKLAVYHGYDGGTVLDPSMGTGNIIAPFEDKSLITGFEPDDISHRIASLRFPEATIHKDFFETAFLQPISTGIYGSLMKKKTTWLQGFPFDLVITNPPYGQYHNFYSGRMKGMMNKIKFPQMEIAFMLFGLHVLKPGGLLIYITAQNFMRNNNKYTSMKQELSRYAELLDAYRLPPIFAKTKVCPDILVFKRK
ncbi:MAG: SAM-dependent methyltransferase [Carboxylicivirga sp.]|jgi:type I restriction-modification system DNA methylase subunit|nr:SAM-dependent methyltransferase [Carboxylicivirga sp.]